MPSNVRSDHPGTLALIGAGLIGGSFALALRQCHPQLDVCVLDRDPAHAQAALHLGIATRVAGSLQEAVQGAGLVVLAVPVGALPDLLGALAGLLDSDAVVTDMGSTKADVIAAARAGLGARFARFVPGHPIAGAERSGPQAARADLFAGKRVVLTPVQETAPEALARVRAWWQDCGAQVHELDAGRHDRIFAAVSHLPHVLSFALVDELAGRPDASQLFAYAASGFRDFTRIAGSSPAMWRDIALANRQPLLDELDAYLATLEHLRTAVDQGDGAALFAAFERARSARERWGAQVEGNGLQGGRSGAQVDGRGLPDSGGQDRL